MPNTELHFARNILLAGKKETTEGTSLWDMSATFPVAADFAHFLREPVLPDYTIQRAARAGLTGDMDTLKPIIGTTQASFTAVLDFKGGGTTAITIPEMDKFILACGMQRANLHSVAILPGAGTARDGYIFQESGTPGNKIIAHIVDANAGGVGGDLSTIADIEYTLLSGANPKNGETWEYVNDATINFIVDTPDVTLDQGLLWWPSSTIDQAGGKNAAYDFALYFLFDIDTPEATVVNLAGCRGNFELVTLNGVDDVAVIRATITGRIESVSKVTGSTAIPTTSPTYLDIDPSIFQNVGLNLHGWKCTNGLTFTSFNMNVNNNVVTRRDACPDVKGILSMLIQDRGDEGPSVTFDPEMHITNFNPYDVMIARTAGSMSWRVGTGTGERLEFYAENAVVNDLGQEERDGIVTWAPTVGLHKSGVGGASDRPFSLKQW